MCADLGMFRLIYQAYRARYWTHFRSFRPLLFLS